MSVLRLFGLASIVLALVLVPFVLFGDAIDTWAADALAVGAAPPILTALLIGGLLAADIVLPTPSSLVSSASGALLGFAAGALVSWVGMTLGAVAGYWIGASGRGAARRLVGQNELERVESLTRRFGDWALVIVRAVPVLAESSVLVAGVSRMDLRSFVSMMALSNAGISLAYAAVGAFAARSSSFLLAFSGAILLPALAMAIAKKMGFREGRGSGVAPTAT